jgi:phosphate:Na+ symporter
VTGLSILLQFAGAVALLLWSVRTVRRGVTRAFGADLRRAIARATRNRLLAFGIGIAVTTLLQSSTATALIVTSFVTRRLMTDAAAIAVIVGANVGTTLVAQALSVPFSGLAPACLLVGVLMFSRAKATRWHDFGRIAIGLGLMLLSLDLVVAASAPLRGSPVLAELLASLQGYDVIAVLVAAGLAWLVPSSLALILLVMSLVAGQVVPISVALDLVLGINFGGTVAPLMASREGSPEAQRAVIVNTGLKALGCLAALPLLPAIGALVAAIDHDPVRQVVDFHTLFNLVLGFALLPFSGLAARAMARLVPDRPLANDPGRPQYLDASGLDSPSVALTSAARETLRMGDIVEIMLARSLDALLSNDRKLVAQVERMEQVVDRLHEAIKLYVTRITREALDDAQGARATEILSLVTNLEHVGDIIDKNLMEFARKKIKLQQKLSEEGAKELAELHRRIGGNLRLALGVFMSRDVQVARRLLDEKVRIRELELAAAERHFARLREGRLESIETSDLHLDILRELKRIHSHICSAAYPVLEAAGELRPTRLVTNGDAAPAAEGGQSTDGAPGAEPPSIGAMTPEASP